MKITLNISPLSTNKAWKGKRFKSVFYKKFEYDVFLLLPKRTSPIEGELFVKYVFYLKNYANSDIDNCIKQLQDILVKGQIIKDDRYIKAMYVQKDRVKDKDAEKIEIQIIPFLERMKII